jgi:hypothetical protein
VIGAPPAVNPVTPAGIFTVTSPSAEDAVADDVNLPEELTSPLTSVVPGGSVVVVVFVVVVGNVVIAAVVVVGVVLVVVVVVGVVLVVVVVVGVVVVVVVGGAPPPPTDVVVVVVVVVVLVVVVGTAIVTERSFSVGPPPALKLAVTAATAVPFLLVTWNVMVAPSGMLPCTRSGRLLIP